MKTIAAMILLIILFAAAPPAEAVTAYTYAQNNSLDLDKTALEMMESLGELTHLDAAFMTRISKLPQDKQRGLAVRFAIDGHITMEEIKKVPLPIVLPHNAEDVLVLIFERIREDYWRGWCKRHKLTVRYKMAHWRDSAQRRFADPEEAIMLIDTFFQMSDGKYSGPKVFWK